MAESGAFPTSLTEVWKIWDF